MSNSTLILGLGAAAIAVYLGSKKTQAAQNLEYEFQGVKLDGKLSLTKQLRIQVKIGIVNDSPTRLSFDRFDGKMYFGTTQIAKARIITRQEIKADQTTTVVLPIVLKGVGVITAILTAIRDGKILPFRLEGKVKAGPFTIPVMEEFHLQNKKS